MEVLCANEDVEGRAELDKPEECFQVFLVCFPFKLIQGCALRCEFQRCLVGNLKTEPSHELGTKKLKLASKKS